jgi:septal ring factor EnvC (AmiA/AmiB activator)
MTQQLGADALLTQQPGKCTVVGVQLSPYRLAQRRMGSAATRDDYEDGTARPRLTSEGNGGDDDSARHGYPQHTRLIGAAGSSLDRANEDALSTRRGYAMAGRAGFLAKPRCMSRQGLLVLGLVAAFALGAAPALAGDGLGKQKTTLDTKLAAVQAKIARTRVRESRLNTQIGGLNTRIAALESRVGDIASRMSVLQADLALRHRRLDVLNALYRLQTNRESELRHAYRLAVIRLDTVLISIYKSPQPGAVEVALEAKSFQAVLDELFYMRLISQQDEQVAQRVAAAKQRVAAQRRRTTQLRRRVSDETNLINARLEQAAVIHNELLTSKTTLAKDRGGSRWR